MADLVCIVCPKGCRLHVDEENNDAVTGNTCPRGAEYARAETKRPTRVMTSTVKLTGGRYCRCPIKTDAPIPKGMIMEVMKQLDHVELQSPVAIGQVVIPNVADTGANIVVTRNL